MKKILVTNGVESERIVTLMDGEMEVFSHSLGYIENFETPPAYLDLICEDLGARLLKNFRRIFPDKLHNSDEADFASMFFINASIAGCFDIIQSSLNVEESWFVDYLEVLEWYQYDIAVSDFIDTVTEELFGYGLKEIYRTLEYPYPELKIRYSKYAPLAFFTLDEKFEGKINYSSDDDLFLPQSIKDFMLNNNVVRYLYSKILNSHDDEGRLDYMKIMAEADLLEDSECIYDDYFFKLNERKGKLLIDFLNECLQKGKPI